MFIDGEDRKAEEEFLSISGSGENKGEESEGSGFIGGGIKC